MFNFTFNRLLYMKNHLKMTENDAVEVKYWYCFGLSLKFGSRFSQVWHHKKEGSGFLRVWWPCDIVGVEKLLFLLHDFYVIELTLITPPSCRFFVSTAAQENVLVNSLQWKVLLVGNSKHENRSKFDHFTVSININYYYFQQNY